MKKSLVLSALLSVLVLLAVQCSDTKTDTLVAAKTSFGGFDSPVEWGRHLVTVSACHDCHSPKIMTPQGMDLDSTRLLAGHIAGSPIPAVNRKEIQDKGLVVSGDLTVWVGPWGISYAANLTSDETGIGNWSEGQFMMAIRKGKFKGLPSSRDLLPPMPWQMYRNFRDEELKAIFAYLKATKPIKNVVPPPIPPADK